mmetsp:Transcript_2059/g.2804  ORF Transcript_2059/g.2804 Transcript_2059/m.2804 type:complete len:472 (-) Transcript_2059:71-1486(-)
MTSPSPSSLTLSPPGSREVVDEAKAQEMVALWTSQLLSYKNAHPDLSILCDKVVLSDKSYTSSAASVIANFLTSTDEFNPSIASGVQIADLKDIIASRMEEEGLEVLQTLSNAFMESRLTEVDLSDNAMGSKGIVTCQTVLGGKPAIDTLERLSLCNNGLSEFSMNEVADILTNIDESNDSCIANNLTKIHFYNNMSGDNGCKSFERIMNNCSNKLQDIRFSGTRASSKGSIHISKALQKLGQEGKLGNVERLDLADNSFGDSYEELADALSCCSKLEYISLKDCILEDDGVAKVCAALIRASSPLKSACFSGNDLTPIGAKSVAKLIKSVNGTLEYLGAEENTELTSNGVKRITDALDSITMKELVLNMTYCGTKGANALIDCSKRLPNLEKLQLDENYFTEDLVERLSDVFGDKLIPMEDNDEDDDVDADMEDEEDDEEEDDEEEEEKKESNNIDDLGGLIEGIANVGL